MVFTIRGKHFNFIIGRAQSMHCAMMQHMTAEGHRHVRLTLTNTSLVNPEPSDAPPTDKVLWVTIRGLALISSSFL